MYPGCASRHAREAARFLWLRSIAQFRLQIQWPSRCRLLMAMVSMYRGKSGVSAATADACLVASTRPDSAGENADFRAFSLARPSPAPTAPRPSSRNVAGGPGWKLAQRAAIPPHYAPRSFRAGLPQHFEFGGLNHHLMYWPTALLEAKISLETSEPLLVSWTGMSSTYTWSANGRGAFTPMLCCFSS